MDLDHKNIRIETRENAFKEESTPRDTRRINFHRSISFSRNQTPSSPPQTRYQTSAHPLEIPSPWTLRESRKQLSRSYPPLQPLEKSNPLSSRRVWIHFHGGIVSVQPPLDFEKCKNRVLYLRTIK